jgi:hypothetical protein
MITNLQKKRNNIENLSPISDTRYENILNMNLYNKKYPFYNLIKKVNFPDDITTDAYFERYTSANIPWTALAHEVYGDQNLWWIICGVNNVQNPTINPVIGKVYKFIKPTYINTILAEIKQQLQ